MTLHTIQPHWDDRHKVMTQGHYDWTSIAKELNIPPLRCKDRWRSLKALTMKVGPFTEEEDILIDCFVREWGNKGKGMWVALEKDLGRPCWTIRKRWSVLKHGQSIP